jgi:hypothetical protein
MVIARAPASAAPRRVSVTSMISSGERIAGAQASASGSEVWGAAERESPAGPSVGCAAASAAGVGLGSS